MRDRTAAETALPTWCASPPMRRPITRRRFPAAKPFCSAAPGAPLRTSAEPEPSTAPAISASPSPDSTPKQGNTSITTSRSIRGVMPADRWRLAPTALSMFPSEMARPSTLTDPRAVSVQNIDSLSGKILRIDPVNRLGTTRQPVCRAGRRSQRQPFQGLPVRPEKSVFHRVRSGWASLHFEYRLVQLGGDRKWPCWSKFWLAVFRRRR